MLPTFQSHLQDSVYNLSGEIQPTTFVSLVMLLTLEIPVEKKFKEDGLA